MKVAKHVPREKLGNLYGKGADRDYYRSPGKLYCVYKGESIVHLCSSDGEPDTEVTDVKLVRELTAKKKT